MTDAADTPETEHSRIIRELKAIADNPRRSREDREKAKRAYRSLTFTTRTTANAMSQNNEHRPVSALTRIKGEHQ